MAAIFSSEWLGVVLIFAVGGLILGSMFWSLIEAKKPLENDIDGWVVTKRSIFDHVIGAIQLSFFFLFIVFGVFVPAFTQNLDIGAALFFMLMLLMGAIFLHSFLFTYCAKIRFNTEKLEYRAVWRFINVYWSDVEGVSMGTNGPKVSTVEGTFSVSNTRRGFYQLLAMARQNGVIVSDSPYLKEPK